MDSLRFPDVDHQGLLQILGLENNFLASDINHQESKRLNLFFLLSQHVPEIFNHVQIDLSLICVCLIPKRRMVQCPFQGCTKASFFKIHPINVVIWFDRSCDLKNVELGLIIGRKPLEDMEVVPSVDLGLIWKDGHHFLNNLEQSLNISYCCSQQLKCLPLKNHAPLYGQHVSVLLFQRVTGLATKVSNRSDDIFITVDLLDIVSHHRPKDIRSTIASRDANTPKSVVGDGGQAELLSWWW